MIRPARIARTSGLSAPSAKGNPMITVIAAIAAAVAMLTGGPSDAIPSVRVPAGVPDTRECVAMVADLYATRDYIGAMAPCLGAEDSPAVDAILSTIPV